MIKTLEKQLESLKQDSDLMKQDIAMRQRAFSLKMQEVKDLELKIKKTTKPNIQVTDHAMVRWLERVCLLKVDEMKENFINEELKHSIYVINGNGNIVHDNLNLVIKDYKVITILNN